MRSGALRIADSPDPTIGPTEVLVQTSRSVVSPGTERAARNLATASLLQKAKARPDLVRQVIRRAAADGIRSTFEAVNARLDDEMPLGYSAAGHVLEVGEAVEGVRPGMRVATGGAGHGDLQIVSGLLTVPIPDDVSDDEAAFATVGAIAMHGLRLADVGPGGVICVVGLGLIGQLTARLALASGLRVFGVDLREWTAERLGTTGATGVLEEGEATTRQLLSWNRGRGVDAVLLTAASPSSEPARLALTRLRDRGSLVIVGDVGLDLDRRPLYDNEITVRVARSYGPGRYERAYEQWGVDYPLGQVRFTEGRNLETVLDLLAAKRLELGDLITHRFPFEEATQAYDLLNDSSQRFLGIQLVYSPDRPRPLAPVVRARVGRRGIALIGAGSFARGVLAPAIARSALGAIVSVSSAGGGSASRLATRIDAAASTVDAALADPSTDVVVIATSHDSHASLAVRALRAGKHVFCEKPLALTTDEISEVREAWTESGRHLAVGFNRRHSPDIARARQVLGSSGGPLVLTYRVNAGSVPASHWYNDRRQGGRLLGEVCHFIDTCNAVVGVPWVAVAVFGEGTDEAALRRISAS